MVWKKILVSLCFMAVSIIRNIRKGIKMKEWINYRQFLAFLLCVLLVFLEIPLPVNARETNDLQVEAVKEELVEVSLSTPKETTVEVKNEEGKTILPIADNTYQLVLGESYSYIATKVFSK